MRADTAAEVLVLAPVLGVLCAALAVVVLDLVRLDRDGRRSGGLALAGLAVSGLLAWRAWPSMGTVAFVPAGGGAGLLVLDGFGAFVTWVVLLAAAVTVTVSMGYARRRRFDQAEYYALTLVAAAGMMALALANELIVLFLLLEGFSLALYILCGFARGDGPGLEAALKYFVLGSVAGGFFLYGAALTFAATGTTQLDAVAARLADGAQGVPLLALVGFGLLVVGLGFKTALVPFHQWAPDVYYGAPAPVVGFMAAATKAAAFAALARVLWTGFGPLAAQWTPLLSVLAVATMVIGNVTALVQSDLKRMLGYSAVAQAGYVLASLLAGTAAGVSAALYYLLVYALMNVGVIAVLVAIGPDSAGRDASRLDDVRGLSARHPGLALAVFLLALVGLPPTAGFVGKWYIFEALVAAGRTPLAVAVVLNSVVAAIYYARPVLLAYAAPAGSQRPITVDTPTAVAVGTTALVVGLAVVLTGPLAGAARAAGALGAVEAPRSEQTEAPALFFTAPTFQKGAP